MAESHAADTPEEIERAQRERQEYRERVARAQKLLTSLMASSQTAPHVALGMTGKEGQDLLWYVEELRTQVRLTMKMIRNHRDEALQAQNNLTVLY